jgi:hypothetical protein
LETIILVRVDFYSGTFVELFKELGGTMFLTIGARECKMLNHAWTILDEQCSKPLCRDTNARRRDVKGWIPLHFFRRNDDDGDGELNIDASRGGLTDDTYGVRFTP